MGVVIVPSFHFSYCYKRKNDPPTFSGESSAKVARKKRRSKLFRPFFRDYFLLLHKTQKLCIAFLYTLRFLRLLAHRESIALVAYQVIEIEDVVAGLLYYVAQSFLLAGSIFGLDQYIRNISKK